jgi:hypothetical protein
VRVRLDTNIPAYAEGVNGAARRDAGIVTGCALFGATAQIRYTEPIATLDANVLVALPDRDHVLGPIYAFCKDRGHEVEGEAVRVGAWPVQFIPVFNALTGEALDQAETSDHEGVPFRVVSAVGQILEPLRSQDVA